LNLQKYVTAALLYRCEALLAPLTKCYQTSVHDLESLPGDVKALHLPQGREV